MNGGGSISGARRLVALVGLAAFVVGCGGESTLRREGSGDENGGGGKEPPPNGGGGSSGTSGAPPGGTSGVPAGGTGPGPCVDGGGGNCNPVIEGDPYPEVEWENGMGYLDSCQMLAGSHGFSCWHYDGTDSELCADPTTCNACLCFIPCDREVGGVAACPPGFTGTATPSCVHETPNTVGTCMLLCDGSTSCPEGMTCTPYPGLAIDVCMWVATAGTNG